jgi:hypothetical protein
MAEFFLAVTPDQFLDADATGDHRQIGGQGAGPLEPAEYPIVIVDDLQQDLRRDIFDVLRGNHAAPRVGSMLDDMVDQAHVTVHEIIPGTGLLPQAAVDEATIDVT